MDSVLPQCHIHLELKQVFYCLDCEEFLCRRCMMDNHRLHDYDETEVIAKKRCVAVNDLLVQARQVISDGNDFAEKRGSLASYHKELEATIKCSFEKVHKQLDDREACLLSFLQSLMEKEYMKIEVAEKDFIQLALKLENAISDAKSLVAEPRSILTITQGKRLSSDLEKCIECLNNLYTPISKQRRCVQLAFKEEDGVLLRQAIDKFAILLDANELPLSVEGYSDNYSYAKHLKPHRISRNVSLPVMFSDQLDLEFDSTISVVQPTALISCTEKGKKFYPCGIAVGSNNLITVSDLHNNIVKVLTSTGKVIDTIESTKGFRTFRGPCALHVDEANDIFILERDSKSIRKYTNGSLLDLGKFTKQFDDPRGILVLNEKVYVTDWKNNCIHILTLTSNKLNYQSSVGEGYLKQPTGIGCHAADKKIAVSDQENHCVWVLTPEGDVINTIGGEKGSHLGMLDGPYGVAITSDGKVAVSEKGNSRISVFSLQGSHLFSFGCKGSEPGQFNQLRHVCTNYSNQIFIADEMNQRVQIFDL